MDGPSNELRRIEALGNERPREMVIAHSWEQNPAYRHTPHLRSGYAALANFSG